MKRREFITKTSIATILGQSIVISSSQAEAMGFYRFQSAQASNKPVYDQSLFPAMNELLLWMKENGWNTPVKKISGYDLPTDCLDPLLTKTFSADLRYPGADDFSGNAFIVAGAPEQSLLYHLLASPRIRLEDTPTSEQYPSLMQIDLLENFIYSMVPLRPEDLNPKDTVLAIFAYEYRPACKTPHEYYADMVFSRSGFARIGTQDISAYDSINRCFTNKPQEEKLEKEIAVTPARYALFIAKRLPHSKIANNSDQKSSKNYEYLLPLRKIYKNDTLLDGGQVYFSESHLSERLARLWSNKEIGKTTKVNFNTKVAPFIRKSSSTTDPLAHQKNDADKNLVQLREIGSSVLLSSVPGQLVWRSFQETSNGRQRLRIKIHKREGLKYFTNRRYSTYRLLKNAKKYRDGYDIILSKYLYPRTIVTNYHAPRNEPMFFNIREIVSEHDGTVEKHLSESLDNLEEETNKGYWIGLFEDNICEGCISVSISKQPGSTSTLLGYISALNILPAYSVVTAPDFFPLVESYDLRNYVDLFTSGGVEDMSGAVLKANPNIPLPFQNSAAFPDAASSKNERAVKNTILSIVSKPAKNGLKKTDSLNDQHADEQTRTNFLPDSATRIFYPGWDLTYSKSIIYGKEDAELFYSTMGLGSPFVEDSKLCAAANGMWAAASPDTARNFMPSIDTYPGDVTTKTAIPLLDAEMGYADESPAVKFWGKDPSRGWDGESGPFVIKENGYYRINFTDISKPDYVQNALHGQFDMSLMRKLTTAEVKRRMYCLKQCYDNIGNSDKNLWLVAAEKIDKLTDSPISSSLPPDFIDQTLLRQQATALQDSPFYLYLLCTYDPKKDQMEKITNSKRMLQTCQKLHLCLINQSKLVMYTLDQSIKNNSAWTLSS